VRSLLRWSGNIHTDLVVPEAVDVLRALGVPPERAPDGRTSGTIAASLSELRAVAEPRGILAGIETVDFADVYEGEGLNAVPSPLVEVFPRADELALFAVTLGAPVAERVAELFDAGDFALGGILDAAASEATEMAARHVARVALGKALHSGRTNAATRALNYSPGYCGWDLTGQRTLFSALKPETIGIHLTDSCLMEPIKSISGVVVIGPARIHEFDDDYAFCAECRTHECRQRIAGLDTDGDTV
jgi:hypothetical protein